MFLFFVSQYLKQLLNVYVNWQWIKFPNSNLFCPWQTTSQLSKIKPQTKKQKIQTNQNPQIPLAIILRGS